MVGGLQQVYGMEVGNVNAGNWQLHSGQPMAITGLTFVVEARVL